MPELLHSMSAPFAFDLGGWSRPRERAAWQDPSGNAILTIQAAMLLELRRIADLMEARSAGTDLQTASSTPPPVPEFRSVADTAEWLDVSAETVYAMLKGPLRPARVQLGATIRVHVPTVKALVLDARVGSPTVPGPAPSPEHTPAASPRRTPAKERAQRLVDGRG